MTDPGPVSPAEAERYYASFPRRLNALSIDLLILIAYSAVIFAILPAGSAQSPLRPILAVLWWGGVFLYEPLTVAFLGGTFGHQLQNLRVVDNRTGGNIGLPKAVARTLVKMLLGIFSFLSMSFSKRHQAIHDILTHSSVQLRDPGKAQPTHYVVGPKAGSSST
ncbi:MAG: RDD family protein [Gemmatimonadota bacterium]